MPAKNGLIFQKGVGFKNFKITGEASSANQEAAEDFQYAIQKIVEEKGYLPKDFFFFNADERTLYCEWGDAIKGMYY